MASSKDNKSSGLRDVSGKSSGKPLIEMGRELYAESSPLRQFMLAQGLEVARTGSTPGSRVPVIQRAVEQQKQATSQSFRSAQDQLNGVGIADTPFAQSILSGITAQGNMAQAGTAASMGEQIMGSSTSLAAGIPGMAISSLGAGGAIAQGGKKATKGK